MAPRITTEYRILSNDKPKLFHPMDVIRSLGPNIMSHMAPILTKTTSPFVPNFTLLPWWSKLRVYKKGQVANQWVPAPSFSFIRWLIIYLMLRWGATRGPRHAILNSPRGAIWSITLLFPIAKRKYADVSFEELRMDDYEANGRGGLKAVPFSTTDDENLDVGKDRIT